jgi:hypothetical protein
MTNKVRLRLGDAEVEVMSEEEDISATVQQAMDALTELRGKQPRPIERDFAASNDAEPSDIGVSINTAVARLGGGSCRNIMMAAAGLLVASRPQGRFTKNEWEVLAATSNQWKAQYSKEKAKVIKRLITSGDVIENSRDMFSLAAKAQKEIEGKLVS